MIRPGKFRSQISLGGKGRYIGTFGTPEQASAAYESVRKDLEDADLSAFSAEEVDDMFNEAREKAAETVGGVVPKKMRPRSERGLPTGVYSASSGRYESSIGWGDKNRQIGTFDTPKQASAAYVSVRRDLDAAKLLMLSADDVCAVFETAKTKALEAVEAAIPMESGSKSRVPV